MNPASRNPSFPNLLKAALCVAAGALALVGCEDQLAGTSVGTGNPTEIQVSFKDGSGPVAINGELAVYASTQIPVEGYRPHPLFSMVIDKADHASILASDFRALPDSAWSKGSVDKDAYSFNVVVTGASQGGILKGFVYRKDKGQFILRSADSGAVWNAAHDRATIRGEMSALIDLKGKIDTSALSKNKDYHLFVYGTGISARVDSGAFTFPKIPDGSYQAFLISLPRKDNPISGVDSTDIFATTAPLSAANPDLIRGDMHERVRLPDSLITP